MKMSDHENTIDEASDRVERLVAGLVESLADGLVPIIGDLNAAGAFVGMAEIILTESRGAEFAAQYLYKLAESTAQRADDAPMAGNVH
jgi:hypothetical protein